MALRAEGEAHVGGVHLGEGYMIMLDRVALDWVVKIYDNISYHMSYHIICAEGGRLGHRVCVVASLFIQAALLGPTVQATDGRRTARRGEVLLQFLMSAAYP